MAKRLREQMEYLSGIRLPNAETYVKSHPDIKSWLDRKRDGFETAYGEAHEPAFDRGLFSYVEGWERVNELVAAEDTEQVATQVDVEKPGLEGEERDREILLNQRLTYARWRKDLVSFVMETKWGDVRVFRLEPRKADDERWTTIDRLLDMYENPLMANVLEAFDTFPANPDYRPPRLHKGEHALHVEVTADGVRVRAELGK